LHEVLVVDVEATTAADRPPGALRDIIEIGACLVSLEGGAIRDAAGILVRPSCSEVTEFCTSITGITPEQSRDGRPFVEACDWLKSMFESTGHVWASFGEFDLEQFATQCEREGVQYPFVAAHVNIKLLAALRFKWRRQKGLMRACAELGIRPVGRHHSARDDAVNAARVLYRSLSSCTYGKEGEANAACHR